MVQANLRNAVIPQLDPDRVLNRTTPPLRQPSMGDLHSAHETIVYLLLLIAVDRIVEKER
jgi:hypothetical protein